jgi:four helix bundle protein
MELAVTCIHYGRLLKSRQEFEIAKQLIRAGTAPGALIAEAIDGESTKDMYHKFGIALKEARETIYWLDLIERVDQELPQVHHDARSHLNNVVPMLVASRKTLSKRLNPQPSTLAD